MRPHTPRVLSVEAVVVRLIVVVKRPALTEGVELAREKVGVAESGGPAHGGVLAGEVEVAVHAANVLRVHVSSNVLRSHLKLMLALDERQILAAGIVQRVEVAGGLADVEAVG